MKKLSNKLIVAVFLVSVILFSGCTQNTVKPTESPDAITSSSPTATSTPTKTPEPSPVQVSVGGDALGSEIAKSNSLDQDATDANLDSLDADLGEIETGL